MKDSVFDHLYIRLKSWGVLQLHRSPPFSAKLSDMERRKGVELTGAAW